MKIFKRKISKIIIALVILGVAGVVYAAASYRIGANGNWVQINEWGTCKIVTNNNSHDIFVPTKSSNEWSTFMAKAIGVVFGACPAPVYDPPTLYCGNWGGAGPAITATLWKKVNNIRYYVGTSGITADVYTCIGLWDENAGVWNSSNFCKYADERSCVPSNSTLGGTAQAVYWPSCPAGYQPGGWGATAGNGCVSGCTGSNVLDNGLCMPVPPPSGGGGGGGLLN